VMQCINGVSSNPVEGRTKICQRTDLFLTLFGLIFRRIYIKVNTLKMFINFIGNIFYARKRNIIVSLYIVNVIYLQINTWAFPYWSETKSRPILARANMGLDMEMIL
jgi:hypothetical protein